MQSIAGKDLSGDSEGTQIELPALLVPGGSCSSLCRSHSRADAMSAELLHEVRHGPLAEHVRVAASDEWERLTPEDQTAISHGGVAMLLMKLSQRYGWSEGRAMDKLRALMVALEGRHAESGSPNQGHARSSMRGNATGTESSP